MWRLTRATVSAAVVSCSLHITLLGMAAATLVTLPTRPTPQLRVTLLQKAVSLPIQESSTGGAEKPAEPVAKVTPPAAPRAKPVAQKKPTPSVPPRRLPKPVVTPKRLPPPEPPPVVKEELRQFVLASPPAPSALQPQDVSTPSAREAIATEEEVATGSDTTRRGHDADVASRTGGRGMGEAEGEGAEAGTGPSAMPDYNVNPKPPYPLIARRIGAQGEVLLRVLVRQDGTVASVELARSSGFALLDESATRTVRDNWRFIPAQLDGTPVESWVEVPIKFVLADS